MTERSSKKESRLAIVLLINPKGPLTRDNVHPSHYRTLDSYGSLGSDYELRRERDLTLLDENAVAVYKIPKGISK